MALAALAATAVAAEQEFAPYVAGVAARIWSLRPQCTNEQVRKAIFDTAEDLGNPEYF